MKDRGDNHQQQLVKIPDFYHVLEIESNASLDEIKASYKRLALKLHPDQNYGKKEAELKANKQQFNNIQQAYEVLSDKDKKRKYDNELKLQKQQHTYQQDNPNATKSSDPSKFNQKNVSLPSDISILTKKWQSAFIIIMGQKSPIIRYNIEGLKENSIKETIEYLEAEGFKPYKKYSKSLRCEIIEIVGQDAIKRFEELQQLVRNSSEQNFQKSADQAHSNMPQTKLPNLTPEQIFIAEKVIMLSKCSQFENIKTKGYENIVTAVLHLPTHEDKKLQFLSSKDKIKITVRYLKTQGINANVEYGDGNNSSIIYIGMSFNKVMSPQVNKYDCRGDQQPLESLKCQIVNKWYGEMNKIDLTNAISKEVLSMIKLVSTMEVILSEKLKSNAKLEKYEEIIYKNGAQFDRQQPPNQQQESQAPTQQTEQESKIDKSKNPVIDTFSKLDIDKLRKRFNIPPISPLNILDTDRKQTFKERFNIDSPHLPRSPNSRGRGFSN